MWKHVHKSWKVMSNRWVGGKVSEMITSINMGINNRGWHYHDMYEMEGSKQNLYITIGTKCLSFVNEGFDKNIFIYFEGDQYAFINFMITQGRFWACAHGGEINAGKHIESDQWRQIRSRLAWKLWHIQWLHIYETWDDHMPENKAGVQLHIYKTGNRTQQCTKIMYMYV